MFNTYKNRKKRVKVANFIVTTVMKKNLVWVSFSVSVLQWQ